MFAGKKALVAAVALLIVAAIAGYAVLKGQQKRAEHRRVAALVSESTEQLRQALAAGPSKEIVERIDASLQEAKAARDAKLADAAESYLLGAREIVRVRANSDRLAAEAAASGQALAAHMNRAARRDSGWIRDASELKKRVERDHADLGRSLRALDELLYSLGDAGKRLAPQVEGAALLEESVRVSARKRAQNEAKLAADELEKTRNLMPR